MKLHLVCCFLSRNAHEDGGKSQPKAEIPEYTLYYLRTVLTLESRDTIIEALAGAYE
jgi:hypothetical protein